MYSTIIFYCIVNSKTHELLAYSLDKIAAHDVFDCYQTYPEFYFDNPSIADDLVFHTVSFEDRDVFSISDYESCLEDYFNISDLDFEDDLF